LICPIQINSAGVAIALIFGLLVTAMSYPTADGFIGRARGPLLVFAYALYCVTCAFENRF
jgi:hypothetical protein